MNSPHHFLDELNSAQRAAAAHIHGPMMVIAGAGSGKTRVLTYRIAYLIEQGIDPFNILALTFTNKAAKEMKNRISKLIGDGDSRHIWMGTFHSIFARILRIESEKINFPRNFSIYDSADSKSLIKDVLKEMGLDDKLYKPGMVHHRISTCKNNLISPADYAADAVMVGDDRSSGRPRMAEVYAQYNLRLLKAGAMDFDDLLFKTNELLRDYPDVLHRYQHKFQYILVDEYQDTNFSQYLIVKQLAAAFQNVCVVGDDAQSIYAFRGANIQNILNFRKDYPDFSLYKLEQNYRSTKTIVEAANSIISKNRDQIKKEVWTDNDQGQKIRVHRAATDNDEGQFVAGQIYQVRANEQADPSQFAILYRTNAQSRSFEESLRKLNIPYKIYGGLSFYQRKEIKDLIAYFRLTCNPNDEEAVKRVINYPKRGIGDTTIQKLMIGASERGVSLWDMMDRCGEVGIGGSAGQRLSEFMVMIRSFQVQLETKNAYDMGYLIAQESGILRDLFADRTPEGIARYENIQELLNGMKEFSDIVDLEFPDQIRTMPDFLVDVALLTDADQEKDEEGGKVSLMTIHAAKGLEFPYVYIVGLEDGLFPSAMSLDSREDLEEERRLFYVALTRAEKEATISYALMRYKWGQPQWSERSPFIDEIDPIYLDLPAEDKSPKRSAPIDFQSQRNDWGTRPSQPAPKTAAPKPPASPSTPIAAPAGFKRVQSTSSSSAAGTVNADVQEGNEVMHEKFGKGKVLKIEGESPDLKATIFFPSAGQKQLLLKFAKLQVLS